MYQVEVLLYPEIIEYNEKSILVRREKSLLSNLPWTCDKVIFIVHREDSVVRPFTREDVGFDLATYETYQFEPFDFHYVRTGVKIKLVPGFEGQLRPRSSLFKNYRLIITNSPGTIDPGYRGEIQIPITYIPKLPNQILTLEKGIRLAQLVICPCAHTTIKYPEDLQLVVLKSNEIFDHLEELCPSNRSKYGLGSTGK